MQQNYLNLLPSAGAPHSTRANASLLAAVQGTLLARVGSWMVRTEC